MKSRAACGGAILTADVENNDEARVGKLEVAVAVGQRDDDDA
jgi:hypothetical protein